LFRWGKKGGWGGIVVPEREDALMKTARYGGWTELQIRFLAPTRWNSHSAYDAHHPHLLNTEVSSMKRER